MSLRNTGKDHICFSTIYPKSQTAYDKRVAGVISGAGSYNISLD
jgi:hypothetical protein